MSDREDSTENFMQRWSRRKREAKTLELRETEPPRPEHADAAADSSALAESAPDLPAFDPSALPPIESITATSDVRAFLAPGVPEELTRAALRRAWMTDPTIRDFVGLAENQGDFTKPEGVSGFGPLELTEELRRLVAGVFGDPGRPAPARQADLEHGTQGAETSREPAQTTAPSTAAVRAAEVGGAPSPLTPSMGDPEDSLPVRTQNRKTDGARQPSAAERRELDDRPISKQDRTLET
jgi:Protein of unknown function (DUF3306)